MRPKGLSPTEKLTEERIIARYDPFLKKTNTSEGSVDPYVSTPPLRSTTPKSNYLTNHAITTPNSSLFSEPHPEISIATRPSSLAREHDIVQIDRTVSLAFSHHKIKRDIVHISRNGEVKAKLDPCARLSMEIL